MSKWVLRDKSLERPPLHWAEQLSITPLLLELLWDRGYRSPERMDRFLSPRLGYLTNPMQWPQIPEAANLLARELLAGKKLAIWGDYDVDGITATTLVLDVLETHGIKAMHHLPDRRREGYGLNIPAVEDLARGGCQILLTVDCGISNNEAVARANELGMTVILSDHHLPPEKLPEAASIINPRMSQAGHWPCEYLAGVGVAFYLLAAVNNILEPHTGKRHSMADALDLVALGTLADVMRLEGENRILTRGGLDRMTMPQRRGLQALKRVSGFEPSAEVSSGQAIFRLAPRINAAGRMGSADLALSLLRAREQTEAENLATQLDALNRQRKEEEERIHGEARRQALDMLSRKDWSALVLYGGNWHPGIVGIVASRIVEEFNRPAIVLCDDNGSLKGSGRTAGNFDLYDGLVQSSRWLMGFGGHKQAAGLRLARENLDPFRENFSETARAEMGDKPWEPILNLESELDFAQASNHVFLRELQLLQPFGPGNPEPVFLSPEVVVRRVTFFGTDRANVRLSLWDPKNGATFIAKAWRMAKRFEECFEGRKIRIAYTPRLDCYNNIPNVELALRDWKKA